MTKKEWYKKNKERILRDRRLHYQKNKEAHRKKNFEYRSKNRHLERNRRLINSYGISLQDFEKMRDLQEGKCAICSEVPPEPFGKKALCVDHNHKTGRVRKLLCNQCNRALGFLRDNIELVRSMESYLLENPQ